MRVLPRAEWRRPFVEALLISVFVLGLFYYWYALADRYSVFLYGHAARGIPLVQPFDEMTSSRYWMCGLVACGAVMLLYAATHWLWGRVAAWRHKPFGASLWWRVWGLASIALTVGIPAITMTVNAPTLPPALAAACVAATLLGLAVALWPGKWAGERPLDLLWLAADGLGLMPALMLLRAVELPDRGLSLSRPVAWAFALGGLLVGAVWLGGMSLLRLRRRKPMPGAGALLVAGLGLSYLLMPLAHHLLATPRAYRYISAASNFFAFSLGIQGLAMLAAVGLAVGVTRVRHVLGRRLAAT